VALRATQAVDAYPPPRCRGREASATTPHITGSKKQSEERAALFAVRVYVIVMLSAVLIAWL